MTCGVDNATGFGPLVTNFSCLVASRESAISSYSLFILSFPKIHNKQNCKPQGWHRQCNFLSGSCTKLFKAPLFNCYCEISYIHVWLKVFWK